MKPFFVIAIICACFFEYSLSKDLMDSEVSGSILVANNTFTLDAKDSKDLYYKFEKGDTVEFKIRAEKGETIDNFALIKYPNTQIYSVSGEKNVSQKMVMDERCALQFHFRNGNNLFSKKYVIAIYRFNLLLENKDFITSITWKTRYDTTTSIKNVPVITKSDTTVETLVDRKVKVPAGEKAFVEINIPEQTDHWVYWIGVDQKADQKLQEFAADVAKTGDAILADPVAAFALNQIPTLLTLTQGSPITFYLIPDPSNLENFLMGKTFYPIEQGQNVISNYEKMDSPKSGKIYLGLDNTTAMIKSKTVTAKIVAVKIVNFMEEKETSTVNISEVKFPDL